jgi:hypothetical protein
MLYDLKDGVISMDAMHDPEYAKAAQDQYDKDQTGLLGSPGMLMGFVSYASLVSKEQLAKTIKEIRQNSLAETDFEKAQEDVIVRQLEDENFANMYVKQWVERVLGTRGRHAEYHFVRDAFLPKFGFLAKTFADTFTHLF